MRAHFIGKRLLIAAGFLALYPPPAFDQTPAPPAVPEWQTAAGGKMSFEVASVKADSGPFRPPNFPLDAGEAYKPVGGYFTADFSLLTYIAFAYKLTLTQDQRQAILAHLPAWVDTERFDIEAKAPGNPTKDQMRLMMQSLLAERFKLAVHFETQVAPVYAMTLAKPGKTGPKLRPHSEGAACEDKTKANASPTIAAVVFPPVCDVYMMEAMPNGMPKVGSRNTTMDLLAGALSGIGRLDHPVVDRTGLKGRFDFSLEWSPESSRPAAPTAAPTAATPAAPQGPSFFAAIREQLGLKLEPAKAPLQILVVDRVERPSAN